MALHSALVLRPRQAAVSLTHGLGPPSPVRPPRAGRPLEMDGHQGFGFESRLCLMRLGSQSTLPCLCFPTFQVRVPESDPSRT